MPLLRSKGALEKGLSSQEVSGKEGARGQGPQVLNVDLRWYLRIAVTEGLAAKGRSHIEITSGSSDGRSGCRGTVQWEIATGAVAVVHDDA